MKLKELRLEKGLFARELGLQVGLHEADISKLEHFKFLPTPEIMAKLCKILGCSPLDIYDKGEITLYKPAKKPAAETHAAKYNFHVMMPSEYQEPLKQAVRMLGYKTVSNWVVASVRQLLGGDNDET